MESKLKITFRKGEIEIAGNREGLRDLADICNGLSELSEEQANTPANHWHIADFMNTAEPGSVPTVILLKRNWPDSDSDTGPDINTGSEPIHTRDIHPPDIRAFCILGPIPPPLCVSEKKIYKVQSCRKWKGEKVWTKELREESERIHIFTFLNDERKSVEIGIDLDDTSVLFFAVQEIEQIRDA